MNMTIFGRFMAAMAAVAVLAACSPQFNWRQVQLEHTGLPAMLPGQPVTSHRPLQFEQFTLDFYLTTATAGGQIYTVGHALLPAQLQQDAAARERLYQAVHASLRQKFLPAELIPGQAPPPLPAPGKIFSMGRDIGGTALRMQGMVRVEPGWLVEGFVMTDSGVAPDAEQAAIFFDALARLSDRP
ncbi:hypothetical protein [Alcaligenes sp. SDU_A2]|uniref:hypothetical protein n=1 Tax=Alcaligenes sp. SDU_A2 TaxID=3136634 RepID=UPI002B5F5E77|nr:hypothetical protein [Alcaligenes sp.]HRL26340.1 hypothetical protein [Alcaligenes sp.]